MSSTRRVRHIPEVFKRLLFRNQLSRSTTPDACWISDAVVSIDAVSKSFCSAASAAF